MDNQTEVNWYVVHTYSGYENKVKANLERRVESMDMSDKIFRVLVPVNEEIEVKNGKRKTVQHKVYPGYVLVEMIMTDDSWYVVRNTPGVTGFVGANTSGAKPIPLLSNEVRSIMRQMGVDDVKTRFDFEQKEAVRIVAGPFANFVGTIDQIDMTLEKVQVVVTMFGRDTPVELDFDQIEKL
ncbi:transcription termination/antitermination protein NusG [Ferroacidibacillus organovorans]|uniref:Transcription termination/antitermination protein NusG n=1 Tax=Ferroacidibacillus organovorans TaxID=1765683 RepID=A0A101XPF2_9BACL|nr:transcription termination/antitermination protein NusG [Ferroacidibacillus organovorans]KUO95112.1 antitermination protein NusG [Ferroacidibacillus organovorans]